MLKVELIEAINKRNPSIDPKVIEFNIGRAFNQIIYDTYRKDMGNMDIHSKLIQDVDVDYNSSMDQYSSTLPVSVIQLPRSGDGVLQISTVKGKRIEFIPKRKIDDTISSGLEIDSILGPVGFWLVNGNIVQFNQKIRLYKPEKLNFRVIPQFSSYDMLDEVHIPAGKDLAFYETVANFVSSQPVEKEVNDGNNKTP